MALHTIETALPIVLSPSQVSLMYSNSISDIYAPLGCSSSGKTFFVQRFSVPAFYAQII